MGDYLDYLSRPNIMSILTRVRQREILQQMRKRQCDNGTRDYSDAAKGQ